MKNRNILAVILFSIITCGIYQIYWFYVTAEGLNSEEPNEPLTNYILAIIFGVLTCGIYSIYWLYKFFKKLDSVLGEDNFILNFLLSILCTPLIGAAIAQDSINKKYR